MRSISRRVEFRCYIVVRLLCWFILLKHIRSFIMDRLSAYPGALSDQLHLLVSGVASAMGDRSSNTNMKIDTLSFLSVALCSHPPEVCDV